MEPGIYPDLPFEEYARLSPCGSTALMTLDRSPAHLRHDLLHERKRTPAMELGTAVHTALLEPERFAREYVLAPTKWDGRTKAGKAAKIKFLQENAAKEVLWYDDAQVVKGLQEGVNTNATAKLIFGNEGPVETSFLWEDPNTGVRVRARADKLVRFKHKKTGDVARWIVDLKTCKDANPQECRAEIARRKYYLQAALYSRIIEALTGEPHRFVFLFYEKVQPYAVSCVELNRDSMKAANGHVDRLLALYHRCVERDEWPDYSEKVHTVALPPWWFSKDEVFE